MTKFPLYQIVCFTLHNTFNNIAGCDLLFPCLIHKVVTMLDSLPGESPTSVLDTPPTPKSTSTFLPHWIMLGPCLSSAVVPFSHPVKHIHVSCCSGQYIPPPAFSPSLCPHLLSLAPQLQSPFPLTIP